MPAPTSLAGVLDWHRQRYPLLQARDVYKLVHQGVFGPGHIITSAAGARRALVDELAALQVQSLTSKVQRQTEPEFEPIDLGGRLVRVNLRPFLREGAGRKTEGRRRAGHEWLVRALVESARTVKGSQAQMRRRLSAAVRWCRASLPVQAAELEEIAARVREANYPAFHHSPVYRRAYQPAYRVVILPEDWAQE